MKPKALIRNAISLATGHVSGAVDVVQAGTNCVGQPMFDLFKDGHRVVSSIPLRGLRRAKAAPRMLATSLIWPLLKEYRDGLRWRKTFRTTTVTTMQARTPEAYCQEFWLLDRPGLRLLAFARGALGLPFIEPILIDQPVERENDATGQAGGSNPPSVPVAEELVPSDCNASRRPRRTARVASDGTTAVTNAGAPVRVSTGDDQNASQDSPPQTATGSADATKGGASCSVKPASASPTTKPSAWATARALFE